MTNWHAYANWPSEEARLTLARWILRYRKKAYADMTTAVKKKKMAQPVAADPSPERAERDPEDLVTDWVAFSKVGRMLLM